MSMYTENTPNIGNNLTASGIDGNSVDSVMDIRDYETPPAFHKEYVEIKGVKVSLDSWESEAERIYYRGRAEKLLGFYRNDVVRLRSAQVDLSNWRELKWEDVFDPTAGLRGVSYDRERVQTSNISNEPYQIYVNAETKIERNKREKQYLEREVREWQRRVDTGLSLLDLLQGTTQKVARYLWFDEDNLSWEAVADKLEIGKTSVWRIRDKAIEMVAMFLKRTDYREVRMWFM